MDSSSREEWGGEVDILYGISLALEREGCGEHTFVDFLGGGREGLLWIFLVVKTEGCGEHTFVDCLGGEREG